MVILFSSQLRESFEGNKLLCLLVQLQISAPHLFVFKGNISILFKYLTKKIVFNIF